MIYLLDTNTCIRYSTYEAELKAIVARLYGLTEAERVIIGGRGE